MSICLSTDDIADKSPSAILFYMTHVFYADNLHILVWAWDVDFVLLCHLSCSMMSVTSLFCIMKVELLKWIGQPVFEEIPGEWQLHEVLDVILLVNE